MNYIELPLWLVILFIVSFIILIIHIAIGDLLGKIAYHYLKDKEEKEKNDE